MGEFSIWHWLVVLLLVVLLFGGGKVSGMMGDLAKGIKAFKRNMADEAAPAADTVADKTPQSVSGPAGEAAPCPTEREAATARRESTEVH